MGDGSQLERHRYLFGEDLWRLYWVYRSFAGRLTMKVIEGRKRGFFPEWDRNVDGSRDSHRDQILRIIFTEVEIDALAAQRFGTPQRILDALEVRMLRRMNEWLLGRELLQESLARQQQVATQLRAAEPPPRAGK